MRKTALALAAFGVLAGQATGLCETRTIVTHETERWFYRNGTMQRFEGQVENTYLYDPRKETLVRTRVYDYQTKKITPDETVYQVQKQLNSHPTNAARFARAEAVIRAVGQPAPDTVEVVVIRDETAQVAISTPGELVVSSAKRLK